MHVQSKYSSAKSIKPSGLEGGLSSLASHGRGACGMVLYGLSISMEKIMCCRVGIVTVMSNPMNANQPSKLVSSNCTTVDLVQATTAPLAYPYRPRFSAFVFLGTRLAFQVLLPQIRSGRRNQGMQLGEESNSPHEVAGNDGQDEGRSPEYLILALWREEP
jgi:hypothetical protein